MADEERLKGMPAIARFIGVTTARAYDLHVRGKLPTESKGRTISATKGDLNAWLVAQAREAGKAGSP